MSLSVTVEELVQKNEKNLLAKKENWSRIQIKEIADILNGFAFKSSQFQKSEEGMPLIRIRDITKSITVVNYLGDYDKSYIVSEGDILIGMDGDFNIAIWKGKDALLNQRVCKITVDETKFNKKLFFYILPGYLQAIHNSTSAVTVKHLSSRDIAKIPLPNPSLPEQELIVAEIETQFTRLDSAIESLQTIKNKLEIYRQSILKKSFSGNMETIEKKFSLQKLGTLTKIITKGASPRWQGINYTENPDLLFITSENVRDGKIDLTKTKYLELEFNKKQKRSILEKGDVLLNIVGASIGRAAIYNLSNLANINQAVALIRLLDKKYNKYLCYYLNSNDALAYYTNKKVDVARANLSLKDISEMDIPTFKWEETEKIIEFIESQFSVIDKLKETIEDSLLKAETLRKSILKSAFEGKLVRYDDD